MAVAGLAFCALYAALLVAAWRTGRVRPAIATTAYFLLNDAVALYRSPRAFSSCSRSASRCASRTF
jgi:hypothetical protein